MSGHTPGLWSVVEKSDISAPKPQTKFQAKHGIQTTYKIARVMMNLKGSKANVRLIAAAPQLLEALDLLLNDVGRASSLPGAVLARAAIKKATGGQP